MKLFQFAILGHPTDKESEEGGVTTIVQEVKTILAPSQDAAVMMAGRDIPEEWLSKLERVEVVVRPF